MSRLAPWMLILGLTANALADEPFPPAAELPVRKDLPDPLEYIFGGRVESAADWTTKRRPELAAMFQHYMYGYLPAAPTSLGVEILYSDTTFLDAKATLKDVVLSTGPEPMPKIHVLLIVPNERKGKAPVFVGLNFCGNHTVVKDPKVSLPASWIRESCAGVKENRATEEGRGSQADVWNVDLIVERGYALATFYQGDLEEDRPESVGGLRAAVFPKGKATGPHDFGTIAAWAWGYHRVVDYLHQHPEIDTDRIAAVGHSRNGKTTLLAAALDERIDLAIPHQAGCGGTAPSRHDVGETVKQINDRFPHWFNDTFTLFNDSVERLPFDQHCLVALCAPRPVLFSNAVEDSWADPEGQFRVLQAAAPVYKLLGVESLGSQTIPEPGKLLASRLGYYIRPGKHSMNRDDWKVFLDYADRQFGK